MSTSIAITMETFLDEGGDLGSAEGVALLDAYLREQSGLISGTEEFAAAGFQPMTKFTAAPNSNGEIVLRWDVEDPLNTVETCIIIATFEGITAPLGAVAIYPAVKTHEFVDRVLNAYVGTKTYRVLFVMEGMRVVAGSKHVTVTKKTNVPREMLR